MYNESYALKIGQSIVGKVNGRVGKIISIGNRSRVANMHHERTDARIMYKGSRGDVKIVVANYEYLIELWKRCCIEVIDQGKPIC